MFSIYHTIISKNKLASTLYGQQLTGIPNQESAFGLAMTLTFEL